MSRYAFTYLTGAVAISAAAPVELVGEDSLVQFYQNPNDERWGEQLCRVLYHESVHFWQFLASAYLANLIGEEWVRLLHYEQSGAVRPQSAAVAGFKQRAETAPFSPYELVECWARYWDVHTRSPARIIRQEGIDLPQAAVLERTRWETGTREYSGIAFDVVMQHGQDCSLYAAPYRWLLNQASRQRFVKKPGAAPEERAAMASSFVALFFPVIAHAAFASPDPVGVFCAALKRALDSDEIRSGFESHRSGNINSDWLNNWSFIMGEAVRPVLIERRLPSFTSGLDVIERGPLRSHPIFSEYPVRLSSLGGHLKMERQARGTQPELGREEWALIDLPMRDPWILFGLPGQALYRLLLGMVMPPPAVQFENGTIYARRPVALRLQGGGDETVQERMDDLEERVERFRAAEYAVSLGLPPDVFES